MMRKALNEHKITNHSQSNNIPTPPPLVTNIINNNNINNFYIHNPEPII